MEEMAATAKRSLDGFALRVLEEMLDGGRRGGGAVHRDEESKGTVRRTLSSTAFSELRLLCTLILFVGVLFALPIIGHYYS